MTPLWNLKKLANKLFIIIHTIENYIFHKIAKLQYLQLFVNYYYYFLSNLCYKIVLLRSVKWSTTQMPNYFIEIENVKNLYAIL